MVDLIRWAIYKPEITDYVTYANDPGRLTWFIPADPTVVPGATGVLEPWNAYWLKAGKDVDLVIPAP